MPLLRNRTAMTIPFRPITAADADLLRSFTMESKCMNCDMNVANLCAWQFLYHTEYAVVEGFLVLRFVLDGHVTYMKPIGKGDLRPVLELLMADARSLGDTLRVACVCPCAQALMDESMPGAFTYTINRDKSDYLYLREKLVTLSGKKLQPKRNHVSKFKRTYPNYEYRPLTPDLVPDCIRLGEEWCRTNDSCMQRAMQAEQKMIAYALQHIDELHIVGGTLFVEGKMVAFTFGSRINAEAFDVCVEKADTSYEGAYAMINNEFVSRLPEDIVYINREEGFIGTSLKKDEFVDNCSDIDDVILFYKDGKYKIVRVSEKMFVGKNVLHVGIFKKNDKRTIYNVVYRDGKEGFHYIKRFSVTAMTRDREYDVTQGTPGSRIAYFSANPNGEAEIIKVTLKPNPRIKKILLEKDFSEIAIKGRQSQGNILTKFEVHRIGLKQRGGSTLGGRQVWFDWDVHRLNYDGRGQHLGEFHSEDMILVVLDNGDYYLSNFDVNNHYETNIRLIEKYDPAKVWTVALYDADNNGYPYLKRFMLDATVKRQNYLGENKDNREILCSVQHYPRIQVMFGGGDSFREPLVIDAEEFIAVKGFKAKGKRITTFEVAEILELEPTRYPTEEELAKPEEPEDEPVNEDPDAGKSEGDILDELTGQMKLF